MAETDGTPRYRKSKPPKGANGRATRNTRPNGKARKRATLNDTLPSGAALEPGDKLVAEQQAGEAEQARASADNAETHVVKTIPTIIRAEPVAQARTQPATDALGETHTNLEDSGSRSKPQRGPSPAALRTKRPLLASTLRMELTVQRNEGTEPEIRVRPLQSFPEDFDARSGSDAAFRDEQDGLTTLPESAPRSRKPTAPGGFASTFDDIPTRARARVDAARSGTAGAPPQQLLDETVRRGSDIDAAAAASIPPPRPRRPRRPGERTLIMTRRDAKQSSKRDWMFVVMLVAALGLTASMFLSRQAPAESDEALDAAAYEDPQEEQQPDAFATTLQPYKAPADKPAPAAKAQTESSISASTIQATELRSLPSGAEVVAGEAVVGSTPVRVARGSTEMTYTLRMPGHQPKVVKVGPQSPPSIMVELTRIVSGAPAVPGGMFGQVGGVERPEPPADVPAAAPSVTR